MNKEVIFSIIYCLVTVGAFCAGKFIFPKIPASVKENLADLAEWAAKFVVWAREFLKMESGEKKMAAVVEQLKQIAEKNRQRKQRQPFPYYPLCHWFCCSCHFRPFLLLHCLQAQQIGHCL